MANALSASIIYSIFIFFGMFSFAGAVLLSVQFKGNQQNHIICWIFGLIAIGFAVLLVCLSSVAPDLLSYKLGNSLNVAAYVYFFYGALGLLGRKVAMRWVNLQAFAATVIFLAGLILIDATFGMEYQPTLVALTGLVSNFYTGQVFKKVYQQNKKSFALLLSLAFYVTTLVFSIRLISLHTGHAGFALDGGLINLICFTVLLLLGMTKYLAFSGLVNAVELRKKEKLTTELAAMESALAAQKLQIAATKIEQTETQFLESLKALAKARDNETGNHIARTQQYVCHIALSLRAAGFYIEQLSDKAIDSLVKAAPLHDIGKVGIPDHILLKTTSLTEEEWAVMKTHTLIGEAVLGAANVETHGHLEVFTTGIKVAGGHHEKWNGLGYPRGLSGQDIPLEARIMSIADMYDALMTERTYKLAWSHEEAAQEITSRRGTDFDPVIVDVFIAEQNALKDIAQKYKD